MPAVDPRLVDHAKLILQARGAMDDSQRADLWDAFHDAGSSQELAQKLNGVEVPDDVKHDLIRAKQLSDPTPDATDRVISAISQLAKIDPAILDIAEKHPTTMKAMVDAATGDES